MSFVNTKDGDKVKKFVSESELEEKRKMRQTEWEKVRKPDQPVECPEEPSDSRTLYDRLNEQKLKKQEEEEEARKMKNFVRGLEHDEVEFLDQVDDIYTKMELEKRAEEKKALSEFREKVAAILESPATIPLSPVLSTAKRKDPFGSVDAPAKKSQKDLLASVVRQKRSDPMGSAGNDSSKEISVVPGMQNPISISTESRTAKHQLIAAYDSGSESE